MKYPNKSELLSIIIKTEFEPFTKFDWMAFEGCESDNPLIGYYKDYTIVIDGNIINMVHSKEKFGGELYELNCLNHAEEV